MPPLHTPVDVLAAHPVSPNEWHELHATYDGHTMRLYVDRRLATSAKSGAQFTDQVTPVLSGAEFGRTSIENRKRARGLQPPAPPP